MIAKLPGLCACLLTAASLYGQQSPPSTDSRQIAEGFFKMVSEGKPSDAVQYLFGSNPYVQRKADEIESLKTQLSMLSSQLGAFAGYELISDKSLGTRVKQLTYLAYYDREPLRFILVFYKHKDGWAVHNMSFDENFAAEFADLAKGSPCEKTVPK